MGMDRMMKMGAAIYPWGLIYKTNPLGIFPGKASIAFI